MKDDTPIAVASRSFSRHPVLRSELLDRYSDVRFNEEGVSLRGDALIEFARGRRKVIIALEPVDRALLEALPELAVISKYGVGTDNLDKAALIERGIRLGWTGGVNRRAVAELAIAFMISLLRHLPVITHEIRGGIWTNRKGRELGSCVVGIIGCGHVGKDLATLLRAFGSEVIANDILDFPEFYAAHQVTPVGLEDLLARSDIVTLHVPLDDSTRDLLDRDRLNRMKRGALLVNTARGHLVDEAALLDLLNSGQIGGAAFDVFSIEPPEDHRLLSHPRFLGTSHIGGSSEEAILAMGRAAIAGLDQNQVPDRHFPPSASGRL